MTPYLHFTSILTQKILKIPTTACITFVRKFQHDFSLGTFFNVLPSERALRITVSDHPKVILDKEVRTSTKVGTAIGDVFVSLSSLCEGAFDCSSKQSSRSSLSFNTSCSYVSLVSWNLTCKGTVFTVECGILHRGSTYIFGTRIVAILRRFKLGGWRTSWAFILEPT